MFLQALDHSIIVSGHRHSQNDKKIRIGYVLKSADVRTLVSSSYSEYSSQKHLYILRFTCVHPFTFTHTCATPHMPTHTPNLINHMKFHVNRGNRKNAEENIKKKGRNKSPLKQSAD